MKNLKSCLVVFALVFVQLLSSGSVSSVFDTAFGGEAALASSEYSLTTNYGTGDGTYAAGSVVTIVADAPAAGKAFDRWTGDINCLAAANINSPAATVTMPDRAITLTATYRDMVAATYFLKIEKGTGDGFYAAGTKVTIKADQIAYVAIYPPVAEQVFDKWTGDIDCIAAAEIHSSTATVTMPARAITLTATYKPATAAAYVLTINSGSGSGSYPAGTRVTVTASPAPTGKVFDKWTGDTSIIFYRALTNSGSDNIQNINRPNVTILMPARAAALTATYKDADSSDEDDNDDGDGNIRPMLIGAKIASIQGNEVTLSLNVLNAAQMMFAADESFTGSAWENYSATKVYTKADTQTKVFFKFKSAAGNISGARAIEIKEGAFVTGYFGTSDDDNENDSDANLRIIAVKITSLEGNAATLFLNVLNAAQMMFSADESFTGSAWESYAATKVYTKADAQTKVYFKLKSATGIVSPTKMLELKVGASVIGDDNNPMPPVSVIRPVIVSTAITSVVGNAVTLSLNVLNASQMMFAGENGFSGGTWEPYSATKVYTKKDGQTRIFFKFKSEGGFTTPVRKLDITQGANINNGKPVVIAAEVTSVAGNAVNLSLNVLNAAQMMFAADGSFKDAVWETYAATKVYTKKDGQTKVFFRFKSADGLVSPNRVLKLEEGAIFVGGQNSCNFPTGTLLKLPDSFKIYVVVDGEKKWISTPEVFEQLGYKWTAVTQTTEEELSTIDDFEDNLIRLQGDFKVYLVVDGVMRHLPNPDVFLNYGFKWEDVEDVPASTMNQYNFARLVKESGKDGIYYVNENGVRKLIPTAEVFNSYNDKMEDVQIISKTEMESYPLSNLIKLAGSNDIYLIEGNVKKRIPSVAVFNKYKLNWNYIIAVNQTEFDFYKDGRELK